MRMGGVWNWLRIVPKAGFGISGVEPSDSATTQRSQYSRPDGNCFHKTVSFRKQHLFPLTRPSLLFLDTQQYVTLFATAHICTQFSAVTSFHNHKAVSFQLIVLSCSSVMFLNLDLFAPAAK